MAAILGINAVFHDPAAALVIDGEIVAAAEEERFSRRKHGKDPVPFSTWELPIAAAQWCLSSAGLRADEIDAVGYSYDPALAVRPDDDDITAHGWEGLRTRFVERAPRFLRTGLPGLDESRVQFVPHHVAHAASAATASPYEGAAFMVLDGRGERGSYLAGRETERGLEVLAHQSLPHSLGLLYEELTAHLGYRRSSDEYKVMALASYGEPRHLELLRELVRVTDDGGFRTEPVRWSDLAPPGRGDGSLDAAHADLAASVQRRLEEVLLELACWLHARTGGDVLALAGGVALNCVANSYLYERGPFGAVWVQPAAGDAGTALGAALAVARDLDEPTKPMTTAALGRGFSDDEIERCLRTARVAYERPTDLADTVARDLADDRVVAWFQGRAEYGPRALGQRSLLAHPGRRANLERLNDIKGREQFRPVAPMVLAERAAEIFSGGPLPSPLTVDVGDHHLLHRCIARFEQHTGLPVVVNTSLNTAGRPMVDDPRDALECFGSAPIDVLAIGPFVVRRTT